MRVLSLLLVMVSSFFVPDPASNGVKIVTRQVTGAVSDIRTEYLTANRMRTEWQDHLGDRTGPPMVTIIQKHNDLTKVFVLDLKAREYTYETDAQGPASGVKSRPVPNPGNASSGGMLHIWIDNIDTGERLMMFGHMARHVITKEKHIASPGACSGSSESETDGWYIDDSVLPNWHPDKKPGAGIVVATMLAPDDSSACSKMDAIEFHRSGVVLGFPLKVSTTTKHVVLSLDGGTKLVASTSGSEVMEFRELPLDSAIFDVPPDFRRVDQLKNWFAPPPRRQLTTWEWFKDKVADLFR